MSVTAFVYPISALMVNLIAALGNSKNFLRLELIKKSMLFPTYLSFFFGGIFLFLVVLGCTFMVALLLNTYYVSKEIHISFRHQLWEIHKYGIVAVIVAGITYLLSAFVANAYLHLATAGGLYSVFYIAGCFGLKMPGFIEIYARGFNFLSVRLKGAALT